MMLGDNHAARSPVSIAGRPFYHKLYIIGNVSPSWRGQRCNHWRIAPNLTANIALGRPRDETIQHQAQRDAR
jgi:hypothetical protein